LNLIDRHVLREWLTTLALVMGATLGLLLMQAMYEDFRDLLDLGAGVGELIIYFAIKVPGYFGTILPLTLLVSLLYSLGQMHRNNEITAMRAAGVGIFRITRSIWAVGVLMCGLVYALNATIVPLSVDESRRMFEQIQFRSAAKVTKSSEVGLTGAVTFDNQRQKRMWFINRFSKWEQRAFGVSVSELDEKHREKARIRARTAKHLEKGGWVFYDGRETWYEPVTGELMRTVTFVEKTMPHYSEDPELMMVFDRKPGDLSFYDLRRIIDFFRIEDNPKATAYAVEYFRLLAETLSPLIVLALAIPFAMTGVRVNPAVGVSKSIGLFVVYFILMKTSNAMGTRMVIEPETAALLPSVLMLGVGGIFFLRMR
jgi:lipopolysaccharide export system permease protein